MSQGASTDNLWNSVKGDFESIFPSDVYRTWFEPLTCIQNQENEVVLGVANDFAAIWMQDNYAELIQKRLTQAKGSPVALSFKVRASESNGETEKPESVNRVAKHDQALTESRVDAVAPISRTEKRSRGESRSEHRDQYLINPKNTFENFVVGAGSQMAHACAVAVANAPARTYNPLFLYGDTGLGKTHLMHAVGHHIMANNPGANVAYITTEKFTNAFIRALQEGTLVNFRRRYRKVDVLLIDDIHFLSGKERIQEEIFHTFNELYESQKQIIISSDRPANEIAKLESRLVSRFGWGMVADIQPPDLETREAILSKKAKAMNLHLNRDILSFLAKRVSRNVRRMEGALTRVGTYSTLTQGTLDVPTVERLLQDILQEEAQHQITIEKIQKRVADHYQLRLADMTSKRRPANIAFPRQIAMYLSRMLTNKSLQEIGDNFGGRDHGTVIHACKTVENMMEMDENVRRSVEYLQKNLEEYSS